MPDFSTTKRLETRDPRVSVDPGLPVGRYIFQLTVTDQQGNVSKPAKLGVEIVEQRVILDPTLRDRRLTDPVIPTPITPIIRRP
jgi:hypothetical protein